MSPDDAYARRQRRKKANGQGCALVLLAGSAGVLGLLALVTEGLSKLL